MASFKTQESSKPVQKNYVTLKCSLEDCSTELQVHKKHFASLPKCHRDDCPNGRK